ncbi:MAG: transketolase, partial [Spirochaetales bacterium]|nr:transketolase [Spirochaetales bacterium]
EALAQAAAYKLDRLAMFLDLNRICLNDFTDKILPLGDLAAKIRSFGWRVVEIDGHDMEQVANSVEMCIENRGTPICIVCNTSKGKGVSFMEDNPAWHGGVMTDEQYCTAMEELKKQREAL